MCHSYWVHDYLKLVVRSAEHPHSKTPTVVVAAAGWSVAIGNDDAGGCGHVTRAIVCCPTGRRATSIDDEDRRM